MTIPSFIVMPMKSECLCDLPLILCQEEEEEEEEEEVEEVKEEERKKRKRRKR